MGLVRDAREARDRGYELSGSRAPATIRRASRRCDCGLRGQLPWALFSFWRVSPDNLSGQKPRVFQFSAYAGKKELQQTREVLEVDILWPRWVARIGVTRATEACFLTADRQCTESP